MRLLFTLMIIVWLGLSPSSARAFSPSEITNYGAPTRNIYSHEIDALALDITIPSGSPEGDALKALTVENFGSPTQNSRIVAVTLWADAGEAGFQGWEIDRAVATASTDDSVRWAFTNLNETIPSVGARFFVTIGAIKITTRSSVQFGIPQLVDANQNGMYDMADAGVFLGSKKNGPEGSAAANSAQQILHPSSSYQIPPQSVITAPAHDSSAVAATPVTLGGKSRSLSGSDVALVEWRAGPISSVRQLRWNAAIPESPKFATWKASWTPDGTGAMRVEVRSSDVAGNAEEPHGITVNVQEKQAAAPPLSSLYHNKRVKTASNSAVYYVGINGKRYSFPNERTYFTWYPDFSNIQVVSEEVLAAIPLGGSATYRPGTRLIKIPYDPHVYAVSTGGMLRWVKSEVVAQKLFGVGWNALVDDLSDAFFSHYVLGEPLDEFSYYNMAREQERSSTISADKGL